MKYLFFTLLFHLQFFTLYAHDYNQRTNIQWGEGLYISLDLNISEKLTFIGSFSSDETDKTIAVYDDFSTFSMNDFLLLHDDDYLYVLDTKQALLVGKIFIHGLDHYLHIQTDDTGHAKIVYAILGSDSNDQDDYYVPDPPEQFELVYKDGFFHPND